MHGELKEEIYQPKKSIELGKEGKSMQIIERYVLIEASDSILFLSYKRSLLKMINYCQRLPRINGNTKFYVLATLFDKFPLIAE